MSRLVSNGTCMFTFINSLDTLGTYTIKECYKFNKTLIYFVGYPIYGIWCPFYSINELIISHVYGLLLMIRKVIGHS